MEENTNVEPEVQSESVASHSATPNAPPKVVQTKSSGQSPREAEHKLKEMSRKAKERKTAHNASKTKALSETNYFWLVIGGLGALGVGYLVFGKKDPDPPKPRPRFKFVPRAKTPEKVPVREDNIVKESVELRPKFELNCF